MGGKVKVYIIVITDYKDRKNDDYRSRWINGIFQTKGDANKSVEKLKKELQESLITGRVQVECYDTLLSVNIRPLEGKK